MPTLAERFVQSILKTSAGKQLLASLAASPVTDSNFFPSGLGSSYDYKDRTRYDRETILGECLKAWRVNPIARRIVKLYTQFVLGEGFQPTSHHKATQKFISKWWQDGHNLLDEQLPEWLDEVIRTGDLFILFSVDRVSGMSYVRAIPSEQIKEIQTAENDVRQETYYITQDLNASPYPAYDGQANQSSFMLHFAANRPVGCTFGEPDLAPMLAWIGRYSAWLEDRARLNRYRNAFMFVVTGKFKSTAERVARQNELMSNPPAPGSVLVTDESETWSTIAPKLESNDAAEDGLALKKMIAIGAGVPTHYLAEPESSTRTTAEAAGTPTFRGLEQSQTSFLRFITRLVQTAVRVRVAAGPESLKADSIDVQGPDITERDNAVLALAVSRIYPTLADLFDREGISESELLRLTYKMAGEVVDQNGTAPKMLRRPLTAAVNPPGDVAPDGSRSDNKIVNPDENPDQTGGE